MLLASFEMRCNPRPAHPKGLCKSNWHSPFSMYMTLEISLQGSLGGIAPGFNRERMVMIKFVIPEISVQSENPNPLVFRFPSYDLRFTSPPFSSSSRNPSKRGSMLSRRCPQSPSFKLAPQTGHKPLQSGLQAWLIGRSSTA